MNLEKILNLTEIQPIRERALKWLDILEKDIDFYYKGSVVHTKDHVSRVLLYSLLIGHDLNLIDADLDLLGTASVFHDSKRLSDGFDRGHGKRAADYYREACKEMGLTFNPTCYSVIYFHDQDDRLGIKALRNNPLARSNGILLYQIFKDADALDRFRLGSYGLDPKYLRTESAHKFIPLAKDIWYQYCI
ncbi:MAG TPA: hypothetical protein GX717_08295 [Clostridiaceae bacterium]|nr:hypothetical protein [Clostridiaceae bacterium]